MFIFRLLCYGRMGGMGTSGTETRYVEARLFFLIYCYCHIMYVDQPEA